MEEGSLQKKIRMKSKEINDLIFGLSTKKRILGKEVRIYRPIGMRSAFIYDVENETVTTIDTHNRRAPVIQSVYEFMEDYGAHHMGTDDVTFEDVCESEVLSMLEWGSNVSFPNSSKLFDQLYKKRSGFFDLYSKINLN